MSNLGDLENRKPSHIIQQKPATKASQAGNNQRSETLPNLVIKAPLNKVN
jgi:hypothetical protein